MEAKGIVVYGADWCPDCRRSKRLLDERAVTYQWVNVDQDAHGAAHIKALQNGREKIPTIEFPDGSFLVEPSNAELEAKLGL